MVLVEDIVLNAEMRASKSMSILFNSGQVHNSLCNCLLELETLEENAFWILDDVRKGVCDPI